MNALPNLSPSNFALNDFSGFVRHWAQLRPHHCAYVFLGRADCELSSLTFFELDRQVRAAAAYIQRQCRAGDRVLLLLSPGADYVISFLACLYAGVIAVPAYTPGAEKNVDRLRTIYDDCSPTLALCIEKDREKIDDALDIEERATSLVSVEAMAAAHDLAWSDPRNTNDTIAFLQYTSGSTGNPKGVVVSHGNLIANAGAIYTLFDHKQESRVVSWLPPYHDMGLIGGILQSAFGGFTSYLMPPIDFLQRPIRWLRAISKYRATSSGGPNFAYQYCVDKIAPEQLEGVDLSSWEVAFNGAENVSSFTLQAFHQKFRPYGFREASFFPCYGLAEATLLVSGSGAGRGYVSAAIDAESLTDNRVAPSERADARVIVASGRGLSTQKLAICDPSTRSVLPDRQVGEIWVSGTGVAAGYWNKPHETEAIFRATMTGDAGVFYLRTGDLGFIDDGELYVTGRMKDLIVLKGANYHPADFEATLMADRVIGGMSGVAAFSVSIGQEERLALAQEVNFRTTDSNGLSKIVESIRSSVANNHKVSPYAIFLLKSGSLPRTSSGKIKRHQCRSELSRWLSNMHDRSQTTAEQGAALRLNKYVLATAIIGQAISFAEPIASQL